MVDKLSLARQRVLVTGAGGFLGSHLSSELVRIGAEVHGVGRARQPRSAGVTWHQADLSCVDLADTVIASTKPDVIFHMTTHGRGAGGAEHVRPTLRHDLVATVNILTAALAVKSRRIVLIGSLEEPKAGDADAVPSSPYAMAKWAASAYGRMFHRLYGLPVTIARVFMAYGPGQPRRKVNPYTIRCLLEGRRPDLSSGDRSIDWIYIDDVIRGLLAVASADHVEGLTLDLGTGTAAPIRDVVAQLVTLAGGSIAPRVGDSPPVPAETVRVARVAETFSRIGWRPSVSLEDGLTRTFRWFRDSVASTALLWSW